MKWKSINITKHLMSHPSGNQSDLFSLESCFHFDFVLGNIRTLEKTKPCLLFPSGSDIRCILLNKQGNNETRSKSCTMLWGSKPTTIKKRVLSANHQFLVFTWRQQNSNQWIIDSSELLLSWCIRAAKTYIIVNSSFPNVLKWIRFSIEF